MPLFGELRRCRRCRAGSPPSRRARAAGRSETRDSVRSSASSDAGMARQLAALQHEHAVRVFGEHALTGAERPALVARAASPDVLRPVGHHLVGAEDVLAALFARNRGKARRGRPLLSRYPTTEIKQRCHGHPGQRRYNHRNPFAHISPSRVTFQRPALQSAPNMLSIGEEFRRSFRHRVEPSGCQLSQLPNQRERRIQPGRRFSPKTKDEGPVTDPKGGPYGAKSVDFGVAGGVHGGFRLCAGRASGPAGVGNGHGPQQREDDSVSRAQAGMRWSARAST